MGRSFKEIHPTSVSVVIVWAFWRSSNRSNGVVCSCTGEDYEPLRIQVLRLPSSRLRRRRGVPDFGRGMERWAGYGSILDAGSGLLASRAKGPPQSVPALFIGHDSPANAIADRHKSLCLSFFAQLGHLWFEGCQLGYGGLSVSNSPNIEVCVLVKRNQSDTISLAPFLL